MVYGIGGVMILLIVGAFLLQDKEREIPYTQWSEEKDYEVQERQDGRTEILNQKAGFSFVVPDGWRVENATYDAFVWELSHPRASFGENNRLQDGCMVYVHSGVGGLDIDATVNSIARIEENPENDPYKKVIEMGGYKASWIETHPPSQENRSNTQRFILVDLLTDTSLVGIELSFVSDSEQECKQAFNTFIEDLRIL